MPSKLQASKKSSAAKSAPAKAPPTRIENRAKKTAAVIERFADEPSSIFDTTPAAAAGSSSSSANSSDVELRRALASLYALSAKMHRPGRFERPVKQLVTGAEGALPAAPDAAAAKVAAITPEHIWGQLNTLSMPVFREAQRSIDALAKQLEGRPSAGASSAAKKKQEQQQHVQQQQRKAKSSSALFTETNFERDAVDAELEAVDASLAKRYRKLTAESATGGLDGNGSGRGKRTKKDGDDWRYAFGKTAEDEDGEDGDDPDAFLGVDGNRRRKRVLGDDADDDDAAAADDGDDEEDDLDLDLEDEEEEEEVTEADKRRLKKMLDAENSTKSSSSSKKRPGADDGEDDEDDDEEDDIDFDAEPEDLFGGGDEDDDDALDDEDRAAMAELYGGGDEGDEGDAAAFLDDNDDLMMDQGAFGKVKRQKRRLNAADAGDESDADDEEGDENDADEDDQGLESDLASRDGDGAGRDASEEDDDDPSLTAFQRQERRRQREIKRLEESRLFDPDWTMQGEVSAAKRPRDSLIEQVVDFDHAMKPVPVVTEGMTASLEERIKKRIVDENFDDVVRRAKMSAADDLVTTRRDAALESEKSKLSLMDLYEKDYMEKMKAMEANGGAPEAAEPLTEIEKDELKAIQMWKRLSQHLDALSNYFFTPKPAQAELTARVRAVSDAAPAITLENVGNAAVTREAALAPQDLYRPKDNVRMAGVALEEMEPREKRAMRRAKKEGAAETRERRKQSIEKAAAAKKAKKAPQGAASA